MRNHWIEDPDEYRSVKRGEAEGRNARNRKTPSLDEMLKDVLAVLHPSKGINGKTKPREE